MRGKEMFEKMTNIDDEIITKALAVNKKRKPTYIKWVSVAACLAVMLVGAYSFSPKDNDILNGDNITSEKVNSTVKDENSSVQKDNTIFKDENLTVKSVDFSQKNVPSNEGILIYLTEEEIFQNYNTAIFKGTVKDIENIEIDFDGDVAYRAIATICVEDVYRGDLQTEQEIKILLPLPIDVDSVAIAGVETISQIRVGMTGIFMPLVLDDKSAMWQQNNIWLDKREIADYALFDSERYAFLETENDLVFCKAAYESINNAKTLDDIKEYILTMIK